MFLRGFLNLLFLCVSAANTWAQVAQKAQPLPQPDGCLSMQQILRMQQSDLDATRLFLDAQGWDFTGSSQDQSYRFMGRDLPYNLISWQHRSSYARLKLYYYSGKENIVQMEPDEACFRYLLTSFRQANGKSSVGENELSNSFKVQNLNVEFGEGTYGSNFNILVYPPLALAKEARAQIAQEEAAQKIERERKQRFQAALQRGDEAYAAGRYAQAQSAYQDARYIEDNEDVRERIEACNLAMCKAREVRADSAYRAGNYELARNLYFDARTCSQNKGNIDTKIRLMELKIKEEQVRKAKEYADGLYDAKRYAQARNAYDELLRIDPGNNHAKSRIETIKSITQFLYDRSRTVYPYQKENPSGMVLWKQSLAEALNRNVLTAPEGLIKGDISIRFDTSGLNKSSFRIPQGSTPELNTDFQKLIQARVLTPPKQRGYFVAMEIIHLFRLV
jgi:tetratricopeptide (TPR) repeat protein